MSAYTEDTLVQQTTAAYLRDALGWEVVNAFQGETFGPEGTLGRASDRDVVLLPRLRAALERLNPGLPAKAYEEAVRRITEYSAAQSALQNNRDLYFLLKDGVPVAFQDENGEHVQPRLRVFDFGNPEANDFLAVRELWVRGDLYRRRADLVGFVNGIPLLFMELKNVHSNLRRAYEENLADYKDTVPHLFHHNAFLLLGNGVQAKIGSLSGRYEHFHDWKRLDEGEPGAVDMETVLKGVCNKRTFLDLFENFIVFDDNTGKLVKIVARNHQYLGVNRAVQAVRERKERHGKLGVFWHTQGSGKSYSMVFFTAKVRRKLGGQYTFVVCTDRDDLDTQIYKTFAGCGLADNDRDPCRAGSGEHLKALLRERKAYVFTLIQKFNQDVSPEEPYTNRDDVIVITDEAHRTQYGRLALNMRNALPNAAYIGFTGTPLFKDDEITRRVFGDYVSTFDFQRAVDDNATVPLFYDARGEKLGVATTGLNERIAEKLEEFETDDLDVAERLERELNRDYHVITAGARLEQVARDFVAHYATAWETGKAMLVCIDKVTCVRMHGLIRKHWREGIAVLKKDLARAADEQEEAHLRRQLAWMQETEMAVVVSEEQGEVDRFRKWGLDVKPHRRLMKEGYETADGKRIDLETAFKQADHPFRVAIVCAMWLTGFDVPGLSTLYLDKPLRAHTLMQAIARANRVHEGKNNGLIIDYCGILKNLRKALATFAGHRASPAGAADLAVDPVRPEEELLAELAEAIELARTFLADRGVLLQDLMEQTGFFRNKIILDAKEAVNENDETRKRFEIMCREVFKKFKACIPVQGVNAYRHTYDAIDIVYKSLQADRDRADISDILRALHQIVEDAIELAEGGPTEPEVLYDISRINFDRLRREFERSPRKNTAVQNIRDVVERKLEIMLRQNPLRMDFQRRYEEIVTGYNQEKDRATIERTFEELMRLAESLDEESQRAVREGLDEESLALYDLLVKPDLSRKEIERIKQVAQELLMRLKEELAKLQGWHEKGATRNRVRTRIYDFLFDEQTGLPVSDYTPEEVEAKTEAIYVHVMRIYRGPDPDVYEMAA